MKMPNRTNRFQKTEQLQELLGEDFMKTTFIDELVMWVGENEFNDFYDHLCRSWEIPQR